MHVAKSKITSLAFGIFGAIATMAAAVAVLSYLLPRMDAHSLVYCIFVVVFLQIFVTVLLPHIEGTRRGRAHLFAAWCMVYTIPIATGAILFTEIDAAMKTLTFATLTLEIVLLAIALGVASQRKNFLFYQLAYLSVFLGYLLVVIW